MLLNSFSDLRTLKVTENKAGVDFNCSPNSFLSLPPERVGVGEESTFPLPVFLF